MSRVGKKPIDLPEGVVVNIKNSTVQIKGPKGSLNREVNPAIKITNKDNQLLVSRPNNSKLYKSLHGLYRTLLNNMVEGVTNGFERKLEIVGVGYRAELKNDRLVLQLGYSHPIVFVPPEGIAITVENPTNIGISGIDKELVGRVTAKIRSFRPPEPYKGKGIKYIGEHIRRKAGKTAA
ncbi:50S ribosomal protein L6 [candidate division KSB1 bacterium]|nr:50S ribosomal protein L6 [candidate division KSB1 bacterium]NIR70227.1 50S ribosomal protein L6 [candidate division KSB1 bacterium]NIS26498.1 50S ribosomal protein L6 [candidate division KSB1 bacterium]NIT73260.1 50S ribosomal protein L6 [candidate division KSB1 bacterium]NIU23884.1 50S ribosomal protein L6 [candidate division KSB1 bacterium]